MSEVFYKILTAARLRHRLQSTGKPVLFIHGFNSNDFIWYKSNGSEAFADWAFDQGRDVWSLNFSNTRMKDLRSLALKEILPALRLIQKHRPENKIDIVTHSMAGICCRYLFSNNFGDHDLERYEAEEMVDSVSLLASPNRGINLGRIRGFMDNGNRNWVSYIEKITNSTRFEIIRNQTQRAFWQLLQGSGFLTQLNHFPPLLSSKVEWKNAIAVKDLMATPDTVEFSPKEISVNNKNGVKIEQRRFNCSHMKNPLGFLPVFGDSSSSEISFVSIRKRLEAKFPNELPYLLLPPIYRYKEAFDWIFPHKN